MANVVEIGQLDLNDKFLKRFLEGRCGSGAADISQVDNPILAQGETKDGVYLKHLQENNGSYLDYAGIIFASQRPGGVDGSINICTAFAVLGQTMFVATHTGETTTSAPLANYSTGSQLAKLCDICSRNSVLVNKPCVLLLKDKIFQKRTKAEIREALAKAVKTSCTTICSSSPARIRHPEECDSFLSAYFDLLHHWRQNPASTTVDLDKVVFCIEFMVLSLVFSAHAALLALMDKELYDVLMQYYAAALLFPNKKVPNEVVLAAEAQLVRSFKSFVEKHTRKFPEIDKLYGCACQLRNVQSVKLIRSTWQSKALHCEVKLYLYLHQNKIPVRNVPFHTSEALCMDCTMFFRTYVPVADMPKLAASCRYHYPNVMWGLPCQELDTLFNTKRNPDQEYTEQDLLALAEQDVQHMHCLPVVELDEQRTYCLPCKPPVAQKPPRKAIAKRPVVRLAPARSRTMTQRSAYGGIAMRRPPIVILTQQPRVSVKRSARSAALEHPVVAAAAPPPPAVVQTNATEPSPAVTANAQQKPLLSTASTELLMAILKRPPVVAATARPTTSSPAAVPRMRAPGAEVRRPVARLILNRPSTVALKGTPTAILKRPQAAAAAPSHPSHPAAVTTAQPPSPAADAATTQRGPGHGKTSQGQVIEILKRPPEAAATSQPPTSATRQLALEPARKRPTARLILKRPVRFTAKRPPTAILKRPPVVEVTETPPPPPPPPPSSPPPPPPFERATTQQPEPAAARKSSAGEVVLKRPPFAILKRPSVVAAIADPVSSVEATATPQQPVRSEALRDLLLAALKKSAPPTVLAAPAQRPPPAVAAMILLPSRSEEVPATPQLTVPVIQKRGEGGARKPATALKRRAPKPADGEAAVAQEPTLRDKKRGPPRGVLNRPRGAKATPVTVLSTSTAVPVNLPLNASVDAAPVILERPPAAVSTQEPPPFANAAMTKHPGPGPQTAKKMAVKVLSERPPTAILKRPSGVAATPLLLLPHSTRAPAIEQSISTDAAAVPSSPAKRPPTSILKRPPVAAVIRDLSSSSAAAIVVQPPAHRKSTHKASVELLHRPSAAADRQPSSLDCALTDQQPAPAIRKTRPPKQQQVPAVHKTPQLPITVPVPVTQHPAPAQKPTQAVLKIAKRLSPAPAPAEDALQQPQPTPGAALTGLLMAVLKRPPVAAAVVPQPTDLEAAAAVTLKPHPGAPTQRPPKAVSKKALVAAPTPPPSLSVAASATNRKAEPGSALKLLPVALLKRSPVTTAAQQPASESNKSHG